MQEDLEKALALFELAKPFTREALDKKKEELLVTWHPHRYAMVTNNPRKYHGVEGIGLEVVEQVPIRIDSNPHNAAYLKTKKEKLGHLL